MRPLILIAALLAAPATAQTFSPPEGCTLQATVQNHGCTVEQHLICANDQPGDMRTVIYDADGATYISRIDRETRWLESYSPVSGINEVLVEGGPVDASFSRLARTGRDDFDFWTRIEGGGLLNHVGHDELSGETATIDGVVLDRTRFHLTTSDQDGNLLMTREGEQFISREHGRFYAGTETITDAEGNAETFDGTPARFDFPGDRGFGSITPEYDCGMQMVRFETYGLGLIYEKGL